MEFKRTEVYNVHEHNHVEKPIELLDARGKELSLSYNTIEHSPERKAQIQHELGLIAFEMWFRHAEGEFEFLSH